MGQSPELAPIAEYGLQWQPYGISSTPWMIACCLTLPLSLSPQPSVPGKLLAVLAVTRSPSGFYMWVTWAGPSNPQLSLPLPTGVPPKTRNSPPSLGVSEVPSWAHSPPKGLSSPPASTLARGSSLAFLPLHSLSCTAAREIFPTGKADLVPALPKCFHEQHQAQETRQSSGGISSKYKLGVELCAVYFTSDSHTYLTGILRSIYIVGEMPGIPLSPQNQSRACSRAP